MSKQKLTMKYHPAKKEVEFHRFQNEKEVAIRNDSKLNKYMKMKGEFVLQDFGNSFFDDIAKAFDGLKVVDIDVVTTKLDYEDFVQMAEYYNVDSKCKMNPTLIAELPDMNQTFLEVVKHGEESIGVLAVHRQKLFEIPLENDNVKKSAESFACQIDEEIRNIREKIDSLSDNNVSLCFAGVYSAGKSALINAILGYRILPENIKSETAKMFQISSPKEGEPVKICFDISGMCTELVWNEQNEQKEKWTFDLIKGPSENPIIEDIQMTMNEAEGLRQHEQIKKLLDKLNSCQEVGPSIQIKFPVALDSKNVQYTIYDTPGTDSNYLAHRNVLMDALEEQRQSILIFVAKPDGLEGSGNNALLNYLKDAEEKSSKTSIDIARSLFVINKADGQTADARITLQTEEIRGENKDKDKDVFSIKLADKKLFFTSALYAYAAKAVKNEVATPQEQALLQSGKFILALEENPMGHCYRQNRCATSEVATSRMIQLCENALTDAKKVENDSDIVVICSGLYALEREILEYGEKYASAVKAFAIIDSVDRAFRKLSNQADSLKESNQEQISGIEKTITELRETITEAIEVKYNNIAIREKELPWWLLVRLKIDQVTLQKSIIGNVKRYLDKNMKGWFFGLGKVRFKEEDKDLAKSKIEQVIEDFTNTFLKERKSLLEEQRDMFMTAVKKTIEDNGRISESAKKVFLNIPKPVVTKPNKITGMGEIYDAHKRVNKVLWIKQENLDKDGFIREIEENLLTVAREMADDYGKDYRNSLETLLMQIKSIFESNLHQYSVNMSAMMEDKEAMKKLGDRVSDAARALLVCQDSLNKMIWREISNE